MVLGSLGSMNNMDFEEKKSKWQRFAICFYYFSEITTRTSNLQNAVLVLIDLQRNPPKRPQSAANDVKGLEPHPFYSPLC